MVGGFFFILKLCLILWDTAFFFLQKGRTKSGYEIILGPIAARRLGFFQKKALTSNTTQFAVRYLEDPFLRTPGAKRQGQRRHNCLQARPHR